MILRASHIIVLSLATGVAAAADEEAEFAFNLFSDIAPILALFGEQFATQFASESLTWMDHLIFAMVPLGILTAITGAIRVSGPRLAKSFIGRARENRALAEIELMSSTSGEVCELFNGKSIVRTLGSPKLAQLLVFPDRYDELEMQYMKDDNYPDKTCGIHTLKTAIDPPTEEDPPLMIFRPYHSYSYAVGHKYFRRWRSIKKYLRRSDKTSDIEDAAAKCASESGIEPGHSLDFLGPPNLQLNLSSDPDSGTQKRIELFVAGTVAILLQAGLLVIACITVFYTPVKRVLAYEPPVYGLPCYVGGSVLLVLGMGLCSLAIEQSTKEYSWTRDKSQSYSSLNSSIGTLDSRKPKELEVEITNHDVRTASGKLKFQPRLFWLQQSHTVSDQSFDPYVILAGPRRYVITSSRVEEVKSDFSSQSTEEKVDWPDHRSQEDPRVSHLYADASIKEPPTNKTWELLTILGVFSSGLGFVAQFMGLRGLAYPCSIAQLAAIFLMALVRALIRRRLGRIPWHCRALPGYELEFLAIHLVFCRQFREFEKARSDSQHLGRLAPHNIYGWRVMTPGVGKDDKFYFRSLKESKAALAELTTEAKSKPQLSEKTISGLSTRPTRLTYRRQTSKPGMAFRSGKKITQPSNAAYFDPASSQQLLRVRERLADLCSWSTKASDAALALAQSIEVFMDTFMQNSTMRTLEWGFDVMKPSSGPGIETEVDYIAMRATKTCNNKWEMDLGKLDAALSLWMASIEARDMNEAASSNPTSAHDAEGGGNCKKIFSDWRRSQAGIGLKYDYCRILGDNFDDGVLKRDISWWVDEILADQADMDARDSSRGSSAARYDEDVKLVIGFSGRPGSVDNRRTGQGVAHELSVVSSAHLPTILAQHLFTSFMWSVVDYLPRDCLQQGFPSNEQDVQVEGPHKFIPYEFQHTWLRPKLSHRLLTKVVRQIETTGLGLGTDILLCMIPALSFKDLLPNEAMLRLLPQVSKGQGWVETTRCYNDLLQSDIGTRKDEYYSYAVVTRAMDFLFFACEPYDATFMPHIELTAELETLVSHLMGPKLSPIVEKLIPVYELQRRGRVFARILSLFGVMPIGFVDPEIKMSEVFLQSKLRFSKGHIRVYRQVLQSRMTVPEAGGATKKAISHLEDTEEAFGEEGKEAIVPDIFGWTALHYACCASYADVFEPTLKALGGRPIIQRLQDAFNRTPVHLAALADDLEILKDLLESDTETVRILTGASGIDGMTALHLATATGNEAAVDFLIKRMDSTGVVDIWGRTALHIATRGSYFGISSKLLKAGIRPERLDKQGKTPLAYLRAGEEHEELSENSRRIALELLHWVRDFDMQDKSGRTMLHHAVEFVDEKTVREYHGRGANLESEDFKGRTALHTAILLRRKDMALVLLDLGARADARDAEGVTVLMFACQAGMLAVIHEILQRAPTTVMVRDDDQKICLHHAAESGDVDTLRAILPLVEDINLLDETDATPLHLAIGQRQEDNAVYLLEHGNANPDTMDSDGDTPLVTACVRNCPRIVEAIVRLRPDIVNRQDTRWGQTPLAWAAEVGSVRCVTELLKCGQLEPNIPAPASSGDSPLHFAVSEEDSNMVTVLLSHPKVDPTVQNDVGNSPVDLAIQKENADIARMMLLDYRVSDETRLKAINQLLDNPDDQDVVDIIPDVLKGISDAGLPDAALNDVLHATGHTPLDKVQPFKAAMKRALKRPTWRNFLKLPFHLAVSRGDQEVIRTLMSLDADPTELDEDNWTCVDCCERYGVEFGDELVQYFTRHTPPGHRKEPYKMPMLFFTNDTQSGITIQPETDTSGPESTTTAGGVNRIHVPATDLTRDRKCIRTRHSIPPTSAYFYYEVQIVQCPSPYPTLAVGFSKEQTYLDQMPGWFPGSWAYHSYDGQLFLESAHGRIPSSDFGPPGEYGAGDTVGVGLNLTTGKGYCTLNGKRLDVADAFDGSAFGKGKIYPCIGMALDEDAELLVVVNLVGSDERPFLYPGPYE